MATKRCNNGHYYDDTKYMECPYCGVAQVNINGDLGSNVTMPIYNPVGAGGQVYASQEAPTMPNTSPDYMKTEAFSGENNADDQKTVGFMEKKEGTEPVVGWLVCVDGPKKGADYKIKAEKNFIGRDKSNDIVLNEDKSVAREKHAIISYNPKKSTFSIMPGEAHGLVYLNGEEVSSACEVAERDKIELGETTLIFIPFCGDKFQW